MVPLWFTLSALCFVGAAVLLYVDIDRRRGLGRRRKSWAKSHGFDYEHESARHPPALEARRDVDCRRHHRQERGARADPRRGGVHLRPRRRRDGHRAAPQGRHQRRRRPAAQGHQGAARERHLAARRDRPADGVLHQPRRRPPRLRSADGDIRPHRARTAPRSCGTNRTGRWCRMPVTSTRAQWDEGLRTVRQFNDLLRVLPPIPQGHRGPGASPAAVARRAARSPTPAPRPGSSCRPAGPTCRPAVRMYSRPPAPKSAATHSRARMPAARTGAPPPPPPSRNGRQSPHYQR